MSQIINNTVDDFIDEYSSTVLSRIVSDAFKPLKDGLGDSDFDNALGGAIATLQAGVYNSAFSYVNTVLIPNLSVRGLAIWSYILTGRVASGISRFTRSRFSRLRSGRIMGRVLSVLTDGQQERARRATIANDIVSHMEILRSNRENISNNTQISLNNSASDSSRSNHALSLYREKVRTGTWTNSQEDKRLYERATRTTLSRGVSWARLSARLNTYQDFARDAEDNIINQAQTNFDTFVGQGLGVQS